ncbi:thioredoxin-like protein [Durotheca rogersii]|uniref:thioredoxin-like protein n=1 Tax=Durotheca rogersii TaxID=419775 RepID=UPI0022204C06|nr:thioredoxin-like protein [Durotheca rogersii]KAI5863122.1 thioredoxin-like protein [Durotheca rogersii]
MGGLIEIYLDISSLYSYIAFLQVLKTEDLLKQHDVDIEIHPVFLAGINAGSGNQPPWVLPAKAAHAGYDSARSLRAVGVPAGAVSPPGDLMEAGRTQLALRALARVRERHGRAAYHAAWRHLFDAFWTRHVAPATPAALGRALAAVPRPAWLAAHPAYYPSLTDDAAAEPADWHAAPRPDDPAPLFPQPEVDALVAAAAADPALKAALRRTTEQALARGAFGAPWFWVTRRGPPGGGDDEAAEPFFGSDRWAHIYEFLRLPYQELALLPPSGAAKL